VNGTVVIGIPRWVVPSGSLLRDRRVVTPGMRRSVRVMTSGAGAAPFIRPHKWPAAWPLSSAPGPQARTAAR
jgi:hypothetical protein